MSNIHPISDLLADGANKIATAESILRSNYADTPNGARLVEQLQQALSDVDYASNCIRKFLEENHRES